MKIYFAGAIRGGRDDSVIYMEFITLLQQFGTVLTEHIGKKTLSALGELEVTSEYIYNRDINWIKECDVVVAEVTQPSLGVGYEIAKAEEWGKRILCLYRPSKGKRLSAMIQGSKHAKVKEYQNLGEAKEILNEFFQENTK